MIRTKKEALDLLARKGVNIDLVVDVGAHFETEGLYSTWPKAHFVMIEPVPIHATALQELCQRLHSAEYLQAAAGAEVGELTLAFDPEAPLRLSGPATAPQNWTRFSVPIITVDSILANRPNRSAALVKIDVDGPELSVLAGCEESLGLARDVYLIEAALLDTERGRIGEIFSFMTSRGYELFDLIEPLYRPSDKVLWQLDAIFVPRSSSARADHAYS